MGNPAGGAATSASPGLLPWSPPLLHHPEARVPCAASLPQPQKQLWAASPRWEGQSRWGGWNRLGSVHLWSPVGVRSAVGPGRLGWPGSPGASSPLSLAWSAGVRLPELPGSSRMARQEGHRLLRAHCPPGRAGRTSLGAVMRGCHLLSRLGGRWGLCTQGLHGHWPFLERRPLAPVLAPLRPAPRGSEGTLCQYPRGCRGSETQPAMWLHGEEAWWGWGLVLWGSPAPAGAGNRAPSPGNEDAGGSPASGLCSLHGPRTAGGPKAHLRWTLRGLT